MKHKTQQQITAMLCAAAVLTLPLLVSAHGEAPGAPTDGHGHAAGGSELLKAWTPRWFGLLAVSSTLTAGLSYVVWRYIRVIPPKKTAAPAATEDKK